MLLLLIQLIDIDSMKQDISDNALLELPRLNINYFRQKQKAVVSAGACKVIKEGSGLRLKSQRANLLLSRKQTLCQLQQVTYTTYLQLTQSGGINAISVLNSDPLNAKFRTILIENIQVVEYFSMPPDMELRQKIKEQCPLGQAGSPELGATNDDKLQAIGQGIGNVIGGISNLININKINKEINEAVDRLSKATLGTNNLSKWQQFKNKCAKINDQVSIAVKPFNDKCKQIVSDIGKSFDSSQNTFIKNVRQYSKKTEQALNTGYDKADAPRRASYVPPTSSSSSRPESKEEQLTPNNNNGSKVLQEERVNERRSLL